MPEYQHVVVIMSMVLGLSVTHLLKGMAQLHRTRAKVKLYWLHSSWIILLVGYSLLVWWTFWHYRQIADWSFFRFILYLSPVILFYFLAAIVIPDPSEAVTDLKEYYYRNRTAFFGTFAVSGVLAGLTAMFVRGIPLLDRSNLFRLGMILLCLVGMRSANERVHAGIAVIAAGLMLTFILAIQLRLG